MHMCVCMCAHVYTYPPCRQVQMAPRLVLSKKSGCIILLTLPSSPFSFSEMLVLHLLPSYIPTLLAHPISLERSKLDSLDSLHIPLLRLSISPSVLFPLLLGSIISPL